MKLTYFQLVACPGLALLLVWETVRAKRGRVSWSAWLVRALVWAAALIAIAAPDLTQLVAGFLGISRGADVVLYSFALAFLLTTFHFAARQARLEREVRALVSRLAQDGAQRGGRAPGAGAAGDRP